MTERWHDYFAEHGIYGRRWLETAVNHWGFHEILYGMIRRYCPPPARILDVGCGPGFSALYLQSAGYDVTGVDSEQKLVQAARTLANRLEIPAKFEDADAFDLSTINARFDLAYSCGVLEHFDRDVTIGLLREQAVYAEMVLIQIPTGYTAYTAPITDERIYSLRELKNIVRAAGLGVVASFGYGDITATRVHVWARKLLPRAVYRLLQNNGYGYGIAVLGRKRRG